MKRSWIGVPERSRLICSITKGSLSVFVHIYCLKAGLEHTSVCISVNMLLQVTGNIKYKQVAFSRKQLSSETWAGAT